MNLACILSIPGSWAESLSAQSAEMPSPQIVEGSKVTVQYIILAPALAEVDHGRVREFTQGQHEILPLLEREVSGMKRGEEKKFELPGYVFGPHDDSKTVDVSKSELPSGAKEGDLLENDKGELATVAEMSETRAVLDFNHPLAGKLVVVQVKILNVENP